MGQADASVLDPYSQCGAIQSFIHSHSVRLSVIVLVACTVDRGVPLTSVKTACHWFGVEFVCPIHLSQAVTAEVRDAALKSGAQVGPDVGLHASLREWSKEARKSSSALMLLVLQGVDCKEAHTELLCEVGKTLHFVEQLRVVITSNDTDPSVPWTLNNYHAHPVEVGDLQHSEAVKIAASVGVSELQAKLLVQSLHHNGPLLAGTVREASLNFRGESERRPCRSIESQL